MYYILEMLSWLACRFPMKACLKLGNFLGKLTWLAVPQKRKKMAKENIIRCLQVDGQEAERIAKASWA